MKNFEDLSRQSRGARRLVEQHREELPRRHPQQEPARQPQEQPGLALGRSSPARQQLGG